MAAGRPRRRLLRWVLGVILAIAVGYLIWMAIYIFTSENTVV